MNDTPDSEAPRLVSRRTVAKTAAWAAPAIALAAASPAHATSDGTDPAGYIEFNESSYEFTPGGNRIVSGTIVATNGVPVPADIVLGFDFDTGGAGGFGAVIPVPVLSEGNRFEIALKGASAPGMEDILRVRSLNYPEYTPGETRLTVAGDVTPTGRPRLVFDQPYFDTDVPNQSIVLRGTIELPPGMPFPADMTEPGVVQMFCGIEGWAFGQPMVDPETRTFAVTVQYTKSSAARIGEFMVGYGNPDDGPNWDVAHTYTINAKLPN